MGVENYTILTACRPVLQCALVRVLAAQSTGFMSNAQVQYHQELGRGIALFFRLFGFLYGLFGDFWYIFWGVWYLSSNTTFGGCQDKNRLANSEYDSTFGCMGVMSGFTQTNITS